MYRSPDPKKRDRVKVALEGEVASPIAPPPGCRFHPRCPYAKEKRKIEEPELIEAVKSHLVACHRWEELFTNEALKPKAFRD